MVPCFKVRLQRLPTRIAQFILLALAGAHLASVSLLRIQITRMFGVKRPYALGGIPDHRRKARVNALSEA